MSTKCEKCGFIIKQRIDICPNCNERIIFKCKCGKELPNCSYKKCSDCKRKEDIIKKTIVAVIIVIITGILMLIPDPIPFLDEGGFLGIGTIAFIWNIIRKIK